MKKCHRLVVGVFLLFFVISLPAMPSAGADEEGHPWRTWTSNAGTNLEARVLKIEGPSVSLERREGGAPLSVRVDALSEADQKYLRELQEAMAAGPEGKTTIAGLDAAPGQTSGPISCESGNWSYQLYLPKDFHDGRKWPVWFVMSAGGGTNPKALDRYIPGAERLGCILALSVESKNGFAESDLAMEAMAADVLSRLPILKKMCFSSGMSGGSRMAYLLAERNSAIAGVLACGSGMGVYLSETNFRDADLRSSTYVYSLIGTNCFNRSEAVTTHEKFPDHYRLRFFPGGHAWAGSPYIEEGMARVYGEALKASKDSAVEAHRQVYSRTMAAWMEELAADQPWEAAYWAEFLGNFPGDPSAGATAATRAATLSTDERIKQAAKADKDIHSFCLEHYNKFIDVKSGKKPDPARATEAAKLAEKYPGLPHAELLEKLGDPN